MDGATPVVPPKETPATIDELQATYDAHQGDEGADIPVRLNIVEQLAESTDPKSIPFLVKIARTDNHWDVSEAACKAIGQHGKDAVPAMLGLINERRPYIKTISAEQLGQVPAVEGIPALQKCLADGNASARVAAITSLAPRSPMPTSTRQEQLSCCSSPASPTPMAWFEKPPWKPSGSQLLKAAGIERTSSRRC